MESVRVKRGNVVYFCKTEEQLKSFIEAGYIIENENGKAEQSAEPLPKKKTTKKAK